MSVKFTANGSPVTVREPESATNIRVAPAKLY